MANGKKGFNENWLFLLIPLIIIIGLLVFFFSQDNGISGGEAIAAQGGGFWVWVFICLGAGIYAVYRAIKMEQNADKRDGLIRVLFIVGVILIFIPWGKACTDKTNMGNKVKTEIAP